MPLEFISLGGQLLRMSHIAMILHGNECLIRFEDMPRRTALQPSDDEVVVLFNNGANPIVLSGVAAQKAVEKMKELVNNPRFPSLAQ